LLESCGMLDHLFTQDEIIAARKKIKRLVKDEVISTFADLRVLTITAVEYAVASAASV
jgi:hypothetical protein